MKRRLLFIISALIMLAAIGYFYIDNIFLPVKLKQFIIEKTQEKLKRTVSIESVDFKPIKGFVLKNVTINQKEDPLKPFIQTDEISFNVLPAPILKSKTVIVPSITIKKPLVYVARHENDVWNFSDLLKDNPGSIRQNSLTFIVRKITIEGGVLNYTDFSLTDSKSDSPSFFEHFTDIDGDVTLSIDKTAHFNLKAQIPQKKSIINFNGEYDLNDKRLLTKLKLKNFPISDYWSLYYKKRNLQISKGTIASSILNIEYQKNSFKTLGDVSFNDSKFIFNDKSISGDVAISNLDAHLHHGIIRLKANALIPSSHFVFSQNHNMRGNVELDVKSLTIDDDKTSFETDFNIQNVQFTVGSDQRYTGNLTAKNILFNRQGSNIGVQGSVDLKNAYFKISKDNTFQSNISAKNIILSSLNKNIKVQSDLSIDHINLQIGSNRKIIGSVDIPDAVLSNKDGNFEFQGKLTTHELDIKLEQDKRLKGSPQIDLTYQYLPSQKNKHNYFGLIHAPNVSLTGLPKIGKAHIVDGTLLFKPNTLRSDKLIVKTIDTQIVLAGELTDFSEPYVNIAISAQRADLARVIALVPKNSFTESRDLTGRLNFHVEYNGLIHSWEQADIQAEMELFDVNIRSEKLKKDIQHITGKFQYSNDHLTWIDLQGQFQNKKYVLNGRLKDFKRPTIETKTVSENLNFTTQLKLLKNAFQILSLKGQYFQSEFNIKGDVHLLEDSPPDLDLRADIDLRADDLIILFPSLNKQLKKIKPHGVVSIEGLFRGQLNDWKNWQLTFDAAADELIIRDYPFKNFSLKYEQRDRYISKLDIIASLYSGYLTLNSKIDLTKDKLPLQTITRLENMNLAQLRKDGKTKNKQLSGILTGGVGLEGPLLDANQLRGKGFLKINEGYIWQWRILEGISSALLIPEFKNVAFTDAAANFYIQDKKIHSDNVELYSEPVQLKAHGWIDFNKNIKFNVIPYFSEITLFQSESMKKAPTQFLTQVINIEVTGTVDQPKFVVDSSPGKILERSTDIIKEGLEGIFGEIF